MRIWIAIVLLLVGAIAGCSSGPSMVPKDGQFEYARDGVVAFMQYIPEHNVFHGRVGNGSDESLLYVRVKVHLSNGIELGPSKPAHLVPDQSTSVWLETTDEEFDSWSAHIEIGQRGSEADEHGTGSEADVEVAGDIVPKDADYEDDWNGMQIGISYITDHDVFYGVVHNVSDESLLSVRVRVRLSDGIELGPTEPMHLAPDQHEGFGLKVMDEAFDSWNVHVEVGQRGSEADSEHGLGGEGSDSG